MLMGYKQAVVDECVHKNRVRERETDKIKVFTRVIDKYA